MADRELELIEQISPEALAHFDDLEGIEDQFPLAKPSLAMQMMLAAPVQTFFTAQVVLAAIQKWKIPYRIYRTDWATHNRNAVQGWGPYNGHVVHCFGSDLSDDSSNAYINRGDLARGMPGPLAPFTINDDGTLVIIGWGTANHCGFMDKDLHALVLRDAAPLDKDFRPDASGSSSASEGIGPVNPHYSAVEITYGRAASSAQVRSNELLSAALMDTAGTGYTGGSVVGHREATTQRGDPTGIVMYQHRNNVNRILKAGPPTPIVIKPPVVEPPPTPPKVNPPVALSKAETLAIAKDVWLLDNVIPVNPKDPNKATNPSWRAFSFFHDLQDKNVALEKHLVEQDAKIDALVKAFTELATAVAELPAALKNTP